MDNYSIVNFATNLERIVALNIMANDDREANVKKEEIVNLINDIFVKYFEFQDVKIECELHGPFRNIGFITITGDNIFIDNMDLLNKIGTISSYMNVNYTSNGIELEFAFNKMTK